MSRENTREKILDAAEELFSEHGFSATSIRAITTRAEVNLAALNYHFGTKDGVIDAVFARRIEPLNRERIHLLEIVENNSKGQVPRLEDILSAFLGPAIRLAVHKDSGGEIFMRLMGRAHSETADFFKKVLAKHFLEVFLRFEQAFRDNLPDIPKDEIFWRIHFVVGAMAHTMANSLIPRFIDAIREQGSKTADVISNCTTSSVNADRALNHLIHFCAAGLRAEPLNSYFEKESNG